MTEGTIPLRRLEDARRSSSDVGRQTVEIERKFLINRVDLPSDYLDYPQRDVIQGYVSAVDDGREVRLRTKGGRYFLTIKGDGLKTRFESEVEITRHQFNALWPATVGYRIEKVRHEIPFGEHLIELDVFDGDLKGLITAEVEFDSKKSCNKFKPPKWFGREVTQDIRYKNKTMSRYGLPAGIGIAKHRKQNKRLQTTVVPIRINNGQIEFCLITNRKKENKTEKWTFPGGFIGTGETFVETAVKEANEEAGLRGHLWGDPLGKLKSKKKNSKKTESTVVLLVVTACDSTWPESDFRKRKWVSPKQASKLLKSSKLGQFVEIAQARVNGASSTR